MTDHDIEEIPDVAELVEKAITKYRELRCEYMTPFVPFLSVKRGEPLSFKYHFPMIPFFKAKRPRRTVYCCGRQIGKSVSMGASGLLRSRMIGNYDILGIQPRFEQIKRFSREYVEPMLTASPISPWLMDKKREQSIMKRPIGGGGTIHYAYAFLSPDSTRGFAVQELQLDEVQDIANDFIPIIEEVLSAQTEFGMRVYSGTPKTIENTLNVQFMRSSQGQPHIKCEHCNYENIANKDNHIYAMIGKKTCICARCGRPLNLLKMVYIHHNPSVRNIYEGYHIPQIVHPLHAWFPEKWSELVEKMETYSEATFENEILGEASEHNNTPLSEAQLRDACNPEVHNDLKSAVAMCKKANMSVLGVDWSGFGREGDSTTVVVVAITLPGSDVVQIVYVERLSLGADAIAEAAHIRSIFNNTGCQFFSHDFSGAGTIREALISQMGINKKKFIPFDIVHAPVRKKIISFYKPSDGGRSCYSIDKTRSLMVLYQMIKQGKVAFPKWEESKSVISDLLNIMQETRTNPRGGDFIIMDKIPDKPDDCAHAVNFACSTIWHSAGKYPEIAPNLGDKDGIAEMTGDKAEQKRIAERLAKLKIKTTPV